MHIFVVSILEINENKTNYCINVEGNHKRENLPPLKACDVNITRVVFGFKVISQKSEAKCLY